MPCLSRRIGQLKEPPANEIKEPLVFTLCKLEICGKVIVLQSHFRLAHFNNNRQNKFKGKRCATKQKNLGTIAEV